VEDLLGIDYSANRSTLCRGAATAAPAIALYPLRHSAPVHERSAERLVDNPFQPLFSGRADLQRAGVALRRRPAAADQPAASISAVRRLFSGLPKLAAESWYNSMQVRFQKRESQYLSLRATTPGPGRRTIRRWASRLCRISGHGNPQEAGQPEGRGSISGERCDEPAGAAVVAGLADWARPRDRREHEPRGGLLCRRVAGLDPDHLSNGNADCRSPWAVRAGRPATSGRTCPARR